MTNKKHTNSTVKLAVSVLATMISLTTVAALCVSPSKSVTAYTPPTSESLQTQAQATWAPEIYDIIFGTSAPVIPSVPTEDVTDTPTQSDTDITTDTDGNSSDSPTSKLKDTTKPNGTTSTTKPKDTTTSQPPAPPVDDPVFSFREFYEDEYLIGRHLSSNAAIIVSKVQRGDLNFFICDIMLTSPDALNTAFASGRITGRNYTSAIAKSVDATLAVNGDFCGFRSNGIIIRNGQLYRTQKSSWDLLYLDGAGNLNAINGSGVSADMLTQQGALQSWCFGPTLVNNYQIVPSFNTPNLSKTAREPRTAIGQVSDLHYIILVVDAVRTGTATLGGMTFTELAQEFKNLNCRTAYNLDGGGSTTLYFRGNVINTPCGKGERQVSDIIYFK